MVPGLDWLPSRTSSLTSGRSLSFAPFIALPFDSHAACDVLAKRGFQNVNGGRHTPTAARARRRRLNYGIISYCSARARGQKKTLYGDVVAMQRQPKPIAPSSGFSVCSNFYEHCFFAFA